MFFFASALAAELAGPWSGGAYVDLAARGAQAHAVWVEGDRLRYAPVGGTPETVAIGVKAGEAGQARPQLVLDAVGAPVVAWSSGEEVHLSRRVDGAWVDTLLASGPGERMLLDLAMRGTQPVVAWVGSAGAVVSVSVWEGSPAGPVAAWTGGADGVCMCCRPALFSRSDGLYLAFRDADGARRDIRLLGPGWTDLGDQTTGRWSPGGCPSDGPTLTETTLLVSDGRSGKRRIYEVSRSGERMLSPVDAAAEAMQARAVPDGSFLAWVEATPGLVKLWGKDGPASPALIGSSTGRLEPGDPVVVGSEVWLPWQGEQAHVERIASTPPF